MGPDVDACECGLTYDGFRSGESFGSIKDAMFSASEDTTTWRYRTRRMVLGAWHEVKRRLWAAHRAECEHYAQLEAAELAAESEGPRGHVVVSRRRTECESVAGEFMT